jgi:hypothetical protein
MYTRIKGDGREGRKFQEQGGRHRKVYVEVDVQGGGGLPVLRNTAEVRLRKTPPQTWSRHLKAQFIWGVESVLSV